MTLWVKLLTIPHEKKERKIKRWIVIACLLTALVLTPRSSEAITITISGSNDPNAIFEGTPTGTNPTTGLETSEFNLQTAYENLNNQSSPNELPRSVWGESPTLMTMAFGARGDGVKVEEFQKFEFSVMGNYWTLKSNLTFNPATAIIVDPNDHIILEGTLQHQGKLSTDDFPHEGDVFDPPPLPFSVDLNAGDKEQALFGPLAHAGTFAFDDHPAAGHFDVMIAVLQGRVVSTSFIFDVIDDIEGSYSGLVQGAHLGAPIPEPGTLGLFALGVAGLAVSRRRRKLRR